MGSPAEDFPFNTGRGGYTVGAWSDKEAAWPR
jgi:hypothetical protein